MLSYSGITGIGRASGSPTPKLFTGKPQRGQPVLTLKSPVDAAAPWFDFDVPADISYNDQLEIQYGTAADFAGATSVVTTLTTAQASHCTLDLAQSNLTNSTAYYFRMRYIYAAKTGREAYTGPWSPTQTYTTALVSVPVVPTSYFGPSNVSHTYRSASTDLPILMGGDWDFGQPDAGRVIALTCGSQANATPSSTGWIIMDKDIAAGNVGTQLASRIIATVTGNRTAMLYSAVVAAGRSGRAAIAFSSGTNALANQSILNTFSAYGLSSSTPTTDSTAYSAPADPFNIGSTFNMPAGGFAVAVMYRDSGSTSWLNSFTEKTTGTSSSSIAASAALRTASGSSIQAAVNRGNFQSTCGVLSIWS